MARRNIPFHLISFDLRRILSFPLFFVVIPVLIFSCSKDNEPEEPDPKAKPSRFSENKITISDIAGIPEGVEFNKIKIEVSGLEWSIIDVIEAEYKNGKAVIEMPVDYPAGKLCKVSRSEAFDYAGFWPALADNLEARVAGFENFDVYNGDEKVGRVYLTDWEGVGSTGHKSFISYHYTNEPFSLSGYNYTVDGNRVSFRYELSFRKGWNAFAKVNSSDSQLTTFTTDFEEELLTKWRFESHVFVKPTE